MMYSQKRGETERERETRSRARAATDSEMNRSSAVSGFRVEGLDSEVWSCCIDVDINALLTCWQGPRAHMHPNITHR